jgi:hypothetical protein
MSDAQISRPDKVAAAGPTEEIDVLWLTAGLGCDGDTIAMTGATQHNHRHRFPDPRSCRN